MNSGSRGSRKQLILAWARDGAVWTGSELITALWQGGAWLAGMFPLVLGLVVLWSDRSPTLPVLMRRVLPYYLLFATLLGAIVVGLQARWMVVHATWSPRAPRLFRASVGLVLAALLSAALWGVLGW